MSAARSVIAVLGASNVAKGLPGLVAAPRLGGRRACRAGNDLAYGATSNETLGWIHGGDGLDHREDAVALQGDLIGVRADR